MLGGAACMEGASIKEAEYSHIDAKGSGARAQVQKREKKQ